VAIDHGATLPAREAPPGERRVRAMWHLLLPILMPWLMRLAMAGGAALIIGWKMWPLLAPLALLWLLMWTRRRRER
jgi:hypothetical protein